MNAEHFYLEFRKKFGESEDKARMYFSPGRVNIIGEHLDYNGGYVLPFALALGTYLLVRRRNDRLIKLASQQFNSTIEVDLENILMRNANEWWNYPLGVISGFRKLTEVDHGFEMLFTGDLPIGVGLSSSASIEIATAFALNDLFQTNLSAHELALLSVKAENEFVGVQCGILDQFAAVFGKEDHALFLNCATEDFVYVPILSQDYLFIISDTNKPRRLTTSFFNERHRECGLALKTMQRLLNVSHLADALPKQFEMIEHWFADENTRKRARHVVFENERVKKAAAALADANIAELAQLMNASHASLRDNYEVSCDELEAIVNSARSVDGCLASRISGAGFGGCAINLVRRDAIEKFRQQVTTAYFETTGLNATFYNSQSSNGAGEMHF